MCKKLFFWICLVSVLGLVGSASAELVARYSFDDGAASDSAYYCEDAEGTFYGDAKVVDDPCRGLVLELDGSDDYVRVENSDVAEFSTESFSYSFWAKTSFAGDWFYFWKGIDYTGSESPDDLHGVNCYHDDSAWVRFSLYNYSKPGGEEKSRTEVPEVNCVDGTWVHIACVRDVTKVGEELRFYVNGKLEPTGAGEGNPVEDECGDISNPGHLYIGCHDRGYPLDTNSNPSLFFFGRIDDFRAYNHALSERELEWLANDTADPNLASNPNPRDGGHDVCPGMQLSWDSGVSVVDHNVYFGASLSDVNASAAAYISHHTTNSFSPSLEFGKTYYWRIDEVGASDVWEGYIWKFTTNDGNAFDPYPADGQSQVPLNPTLYWTPGCLAATHDFYYGTDYDEVNAADGSSEPNVYYEDLGDVNSFDACTPDYSTCYYWRVDEVNGLTEWRGKVLTFKSEGAIFDPNLRVWYELDETEGTVAADSSGREYDGDLDGNSVWDANGYYDGCLNMDDNGSIIVPMGVLGEIDKEITIAVWLNSGISKRDDNVVCAAGADWEPNYVRVAVPDDDDDVYWRAGRDDANDKICWDGGNPKAWKGSWNHFAFVKDENTGKMQIYLNGLLAVEETGASVGTLAAIRNRRFKIGAETDDASGYIGKIDDFRLYDRALTADEIAAIFRGGDLASAWGPSPYNGQPEVPYDVGLIWRPGNYVRDPNAHEVYFGTDFDDVNDANNSLPVGTSVYKGVQSIDSNSYDPPGLLDLQQTYYWRIDEVNDANNDRWKGKVWSFTVAEYIAVDDMEDYDNIWDGWYYGSDTLSNAELSLWTTSPLRGEQTMKFTYDNSIPFDPFTGLWYFSEIESKNLEPNDWTDFDLKRLAVWFYGESDNAITGVEPMFLAVEDYNNVYVELRYGDGEDEDADDITIEQWQEWTILLSSLNDANLASMRTLFIRFGEERFWPFPGGYGYVYFDDIRVYPSVCVPSIRKPTADLNYDCTVDFGDVEIMAGEWLEVDVNLGQVQAPKDANLVGWWKLDDGSGSVAADSSSSYNNPGTIEVLDVNVFWVAGHDGNALEFDGGRVRVPDAQELRPMDQVSACAWIYYSEEQNAGRIVVKGPDNKECYEIEISDYDSLVFHVRDGNDANAESYPRHAAESNEDTLDRDEWIHVAGTYDGNSVRCYINGELAAVNHDANTNTIKFLSQDSNDLAIGSMSDDDRAPFEGTIDDVRVYNYGLSEEEIRHIATNGKKVFTVQSVANLYNDEDLGKRAVNFRDFAVLADGWLEKKLWPE